MEGRRKGPECASQPIRKGKGQPIWMLPWERVEGRRGRRQVGEEEWCATRGGEKEASRGRWSFPIQASSF